ncbi:MAG: YdjY domain-containing protein, partial [Planctomycetota bacterium]
MRGTPLAAACLIAATAVAGQQPAVDAKAKSVTVPATVARQGVYEQLKGAIEYILVAEGGKEYETVFTTPCTPAAIDQALRRIGLTGGRPAADGKPPQGQPVRIRAVYEADGKAVTRPADAFVAYRKTGKPLDPGTWTFTGSTQAYDPARNQQVLQAALTRSIVGLHHTDASPLLQNPRAEAAKENIYKANADTLPKPGTAVRLVFQRVMPEVAAGTRRVHVFITGRVQG